jgi:mRNA-degrading endonuclease RelE of RelBE toxin-antitoxin system
MEIIETAIFTKQVQKILTDEEYRDLQNILVCNPEVGDLIQDTGGLRKVRVASGGKGKRSGSRAIYYWISEDPKILMLMIYTKAKQEDLTTDQRKKLRLILELED